MRGRLIEFFLRMKSLVRRKQLDRELEDELAFHLEMREQRNFEAGMTANEARYAARRRLGNTTRLREGMREMWTFASLETLWGDVRYGARALRPNAGFAAVTPPSFRTDVGANTAT